jgi:hypothetical protein
MKRFNEVGPVIRLCLEYTPYTYTGYLKELVAAVDKLSSREEVEALIRGSDTLNMDSFSHKICLIRRHRKSYVVSFISPGVLNRIRIRLKDMEWSDLVKLQQDSSGAELTCMLSDHFFFEIALHQAFSKRIKFDAQVMFKTSQSNS